MYTRRRKYGKRKNVGKKRGGGERGAPYNRRPSLSRRSSVTRSRRNALHPLRPFEAWADEDIEDELELMDRFIQEELTKIRENEERGIDTNANLNIIRILTAKKHRLNTEKQIRQVLQRQR
jgi:hypothetical protein